MFSAEIDKTQNSTITVTVKQHCVRRNAEGAEGFKAKKTYVKENHWKAGTTMKLHGRQWRFGDSRCLSANKQRGCLAKLKGVERKDRESLRGLLTPKSERGERTANNGRRDRDAAKDERGDGSG